ncbi:fructosamine kinase family protein [Streptomyces sp. TR06-5]|uniref:fructosamine kinase family protein n=1 Tax=unclassified Streptomyces TaxID=2593676 RepID=UPI0039A0E4AD
MSAGARVARRAAELLGGPAGDARPVPGGDICEAFRLDAGGRAVFAKTLTAPPPGFFRAEAAGLALLGGSGAVAVPEVLAVADDLLVLEWVEPGRPGPEAAERLGRDLAALHGTPAEAWGTPGRPAYLGPLPLPSPPQPLTSAGDWPAFHAEHRLLPFVRQAVDRGNLAGDDVRAVERLCDRLDEVAGPPQPPAVIHGDLWSGNVHWAADAPAGSPQPGRARLLDPAAQGGHPETDTAMLQLFGCPFLERVLAAYDEARPVPGRAARVPLHQLQHLLVHAVLFGGGYGARCGAAARAALG